MSHISASNTGDLALPTVGAVANSENNGLHGGSDHSSADAHAVSISSENPTQVTCSELDWISLLNPKISTRNGEFTFYPGAALSEFLVHLFHPFGTPFLYFWIRLSKGKRLADIWLHNHSFQAPSVARPLFSRQSVWTNMSGLLNFCHFQYVIHISVLLPMFLAFVRVRQLSSALDASISQDYTHEAWFLFFLRAAWCAVVGIKYGFYSAPLLKHVKLHAVESSRISSEQILMNWCPDLGRLMFELLVVTAHSPFFRSAFLSISKNHPVVSYLLRCKEVCDAPLCLLPPNSISRILQKLPEKNFHKLFWTKPVTCLDPSRHCDDSATIEVESYSKYVQELNLSVNNHSKIETTSGAFELHPSDITVDQPLNTSASTKPIQSTEDTSSMTGPSNASARRFKLESETASYSSKHVDVPVFVLMAYAISRANYFGSAWIRPGMADCRMHYVLMFLTLIFYLIPGLMRVSQPQLCNRLNSCRSICGAFLCNTNVTPEYFGQKWGDIVLHAFWGIGLYFWLPTMFNFMCCSIFELFRRAKIIEAWADILRHGRDRSLSTGMRLASKESVMTWYRCREVCCLLFATCGIMTQHEKALSRFRGKIKTRLDAVACLSFCIPAGLIAALLGSMFTKSGTTPKFFAMCLYLSLVFLVWFVASVHFGSINNKSQEQELIMMSRLIAYAETLLASKTSQDSGINMEAIQEICDGINTVQTTLKTVYSILPEKVFFWLRADWTVVWSMGAGVFAIGTVIYQQANSDGGCRLIDGVLDYAKGTLQNSTCVSSA